MLSQEAVTALVFYAVYILHKMWWETIPFYTFMNVPAQLL